ncbi:superfamily II DNA/RNA helicase [Corynebacterium humireducens NBRC 106098 = DSM 45392]|uniref:Superfamily II DNA/RNA helicase n=2 Tax=Corynebacterium humireducens TaxID=1223514 RepID=A0A0B5DDP6_9CORY|nr:superfamily II DNA/RNA helicase [Corynebacterium humireducens NBRC 106098 = DSM 45392]
MDALSALRENPTHGNHGLSFEKLMVNYFKLDPTLAKEYDEVYEWSDWPYNDNLPDTGIDLVARHAESGRWAAIQCKFYAPTTYLQKSHLDTFFERSGRTFTTERGVETFANRIIVSTTDRWSRNAEEMLENQPIPVSRIGIGAMAESPINWDIAYPNSELTINLSRRETFKPRPHQHTAIEKTLAGFDTHDRGKLIMACGTGKTFTALRLAEQVAIRNAPPTATKEEDRKNRANARVLFLVPSISLLSQTLREWTAQTELDLRAYAVCSDSKVSKAAEDIATYDLEVPVSTNGRDIAARLAQRKRAAGLTVVFSTYQSLPAIHDAQQEGLADFDLVICDEAHRTTGVTLAGEDASNFVRIHDNNYVKAAKRLYMTATPRLFDDAVKGKAAEHSAELASMDDESVYGPEFHRLGFGEAVEKGLLTDYKVLVMTVDEQLASDTMARFTPQPGQELTLDMASAMIGTWTALAKRSGREQGTKSGFEEDAAPMQRTVAFARDIKTSKKIAESFPTLISNFTDTLREKAATNDISLHNIDLEVGAHHVDGGMNAMERSSHLTWLEAPLRENKTRILTNARCLSEGVDVPALDSVVFFNPRNSMVDVVQSVGRVMRKSEGKDYGYIILPVAVPPGVSPSQALNDNVRFKVVWQILNALRAHDDRFNAQVNSISLNEGDVKDLPVVTDHVGATSGTEAYADADNTATQMVLFSLEQWQEALYTKLVDKVGTRTYWEDWADDVADIAEAQVLRITSLIDAADTPVRAEFERFVEGLRGNLNDSITEAEAISMLSQHLITAPVFDALFADSDFISHNPVAQVMNRMVEALADSQLESETESLTKFYDSVRIRAAEVTSASGKQTVIKELYERFFRKAFKKQSDALGIVYTPIEIVDFILRTADDVSRKHFGRGLTGEGVHILDPFTGTGTFMVRLLQSGLITPEDLARKYATELHATEIMLLAYYVAAVNIESTYQALREEAAQREGTESPAYEPFEGIALADTFQIHEEDDQLDLDYFVDNNSRIERQKKAPVRVIIGNPPYSVGQTSANDLNANLKYPTLDARISETYAAKSTATNKNSLYDSYLRAYRWATDRIGNQGVVAFVSNGGWIDGNTGDGVRLSMAEDFTDLYVFNLRGNARTAGEVRRKEAGNVFRDGGRTSIAITIGVIDPDKTGCTIHYRDIGDYLSAEEKLKIVDRSTVENTQWQVIVPNKHGDWVSQRSEDFETWPVLAGKDNSELRFFNTFSAGLKTARDAWCYAPTSAQVEENMRLLIDTYESARQAFPDWAADNGIAKPREADVNQFLAQNPEYANLRKISWNRSLKNQLAKNDSIDLRSAAITTSLYRPFTSYQVYFDRPVNDMVYRMPSMFPTPQHTNIGIESAGASSPTGWSVLASSLMPDVQLLGNGQFFPRFTWEPVEAPKGQLAYGQVLVDAQMEPSRYGDIGEIVDGYRRVDNVTDEIKHLYREALGDDVTGDDIFHYVYGQLHDPQYRETYEADLKKMLPHIETPTDRSRFDQVSAAGKELMDLHVGYEDVAPWPVTVEVKPSADPDDRETWRVTALKWAKYRDPETKKLVNDVTRMIYNPKVTISDIPAEADEYMLGSRSALAWIIDRYKVKKDKASGIVNDPNDWADEVGNPRYIAELIAKVTRVAVETVRIVDGLREGTE